MADNPSLAVELTPRGTAAVGGDGAGPTKPKRAKGGQSRAMAAQQRERLGVLCKPVIRRHVMKDLTKV